MSKYLIVQAIDNTYPTPNRQTPLTLTVNYNTNALPLITVVSPINLSYVNNNLTISGTANALGGETISLVQISLDGGVTFVTASGTSSWVATLTVPTADPHMTTYNIVTRGLTSRGVFGVPSPLRPYSILKTASLLWRQLVLLIKDSSFQEHCQ
jgi:hypothetical protein